MLGKCKEYILFFGVLTSLVILVEVPSLSTKLVEATGLLMDKMGSERLVEGVGSAYTLSSTSNTGSSN